MLRFFSNIPIFRRIFIAFTLVFVVPGIVLISLAGFFLSSLTAQNQDVSTSVDSQSQAAQQGDNLQQMNALLQARFSNVFASLGGKIVDPSLPNSGSLIGTDIAAQEVGFDQFLQTYINNYELATSPQMVSVRSILLSNDAEAGNALINDQQQSLNAINTRLWPLYQRFQRQETEMLDALDPAVHLRAVPLSQQELNQLYQR